MNRGTSHRQEIGELIASTAWIDTHEHLIEENRRLGETDCLIQVEDVQFILPADFVSLIAAYALDDLIVAGLDQAAADRVVSPDYSPAEKWSFIEKSFELSRHTGFLRAVDLSTQQLFGLSLGPDTCEEIDAQLRRLRSPGFYRRVLNDVARVERCHVHSTDPEPFCESADPELLQQDLSIGPLAFGRHPRIEAMSGLEIVTLDDYLELIDWCFDQYASRAVAVKCSWAYWRPLSVGLDPDPPHQAFERLRQGSASIEEQRRVEDFLLVRCIELATENGLPVKIHTGYLGGTRVPYYRWVPDHMRQLVPLIQAFPSTRFVLMHIGWPQTEQLLAVAKHHPNVWVDLCWAWIVAPRSTGEFLERFLTTVPANKLLCFGGDYPAVENVVGHAELARRGLAHALSDLVESDWLSKTEAMALIPRLMRTNADELFPNPS